MSVAVDVVHGDEIVSYEEALRTQAEACESMGSTLSHDVLVELVELAAPGAPLGPMLGDLAKVRAGDLVGLRLLAAAHRMVLARMAPALARFYPTVGGCQPTNDGERRELRHALVEAFGSHEKLVRRCLEQIPQTNETGRALPLRGALGRVSAAHGHPVRLHELAASAGLNLRADAMPWATVPMCAAVELAERAGCDLRPLDVRVPEDRLTLASYVWGDDLARFERLRTSFVLAHRIPAKIRKMGAGAYVAALAHSDPVPGQTLVVWHSATWFYLDRTARMEIRSAMRKLAARATPKNPLVHLSWEWLRDSPDPAKTYALVGRSWPAAGAWAPWRPGTSVQLGAGPAHGMPMRWMEPKPLPSDPLEF